MQNQARTAADGSLVALVDCDTFYASCERVCRPDLEGKPIVVLSNNDGCIVARSREAKKLGIQIGEPEFQFRPSGHPTLSHLGLNDNSWRCREGATEDIPPGIWLCQGHGHVDRSFKSGQRTTQYAGFDWKRKINARKAKRAHGSDGQTPPA